jgi:hypothetical protein
MLDRYDLLCGTIFAYIVHDVNLRYVETLSHEEMSTVDGEL